MKNFKLLSLAIIATFFITNAEAKKFFSFFKHHNHQVSNDEDFLNPAGIWIKMNKQNPINNRVGDKADISGEFCKAWKRSDNEKVDCRWFKETDLEVTAFFPDFTNEIDVTITKDDNKGYFSYQTPELTGNALNTFIFKVGLLSPKTKFLLALKSKLDKRILIIQRHIDRHNQKSHRFDRHISRLERDIIVLTNIVNKIQNKLSVQDEILAEYRLPLQVENNKAAGLYYSSIYYDLKYEFSMDQGSLIEGEPASIHSKITRVPSNRLLLMEGDFYTHYEFNGNTIKELGPMNLGKGESIEYTYNIDAVNPNADNNFEVKLLKEYGQYGFLKNSKFGKHFSESKFSKFFSKFFHKKPKHSLWGSHELIYNVASDSSAPVWTGSMSHTKGSYVDTVPTVNLMLADIFGRINLDTLKADLTYNGESFNSLSELGLFNPRDAQEIELTGSFNNRGDGQYDIRFSGSDYAGNSAPDLDFSYILDTAVPVLSINKEDPIYSNNENFSFIYDVIDNSPVTTIIKHNDNIITDTANIILKDKKNTFWLQSTDAAGNLSNIIELKEVHLDQDAPELSINLADNMYLNNKDITLLIDINDYLQTDTTIKFNNNIVHNSNMKNISLDLELIPGVNTFEIITTDLAGNTTTKNINNLIFDGVNPELILSSTIPNLTLNNNLEIVASVIDDSPVTINLIINDQLSQFHDQKFLSSSFGLTEGINTVEIYAVDAAGNYSERIIKSLTLDSIPAIITDLIPADNHIITNFKTNLSGKSNELLMAASVNGSPLTLSSDKLSYTGELDVNMEGDITLSYEFIDLAGNISRYETDHQVILKLLDKDLISVEPSDNIGKVKIVGAPSAAYNSIEIQIKAGIFSSKTITANADGSFETEMDAFSSAILTAELVEQNRSESITVTYEAETSFAGVVRDTDNNPIPGVTVNIVGSNKTAITDETGTFNFEMPPTGDQRVEIDGTTASIDAIGPNKKYFKTHINVSIGYNQKNILEDTIYLSPLMFDGTETEVEAGVETIVTSPHAPGVEVVIPAGSAVFPDGEGVGTINIAEVSSERLSVPVPEFAVPDTVIALEPSGLVFKEPIEVTLPNVNEFPAGMEVLILSKSSEKGTWEIDGSAKVTDDGNSITSLPGQGITHFSEIFMVPYFPKVRELSKFDQRGADLTSGIFSTSIGLPSYKALGQDISPSLIYKSDWANPNIMISNIFEVPKHVVKRTAYNQSGGSIFGTGNASVELLQWLNPEYIDAQFSSEDFVSEKIRFNKLPRKAVVTYAQDTSHLDSGIHPYTSVYELQLRQMTIVIQRTKTKKLFGKTRTTETRSLQSALLDQVFGSQIDGLFHVNNKKESSVGAGWDIAGVQKILNKDSNRIMIDEGNGSQSTYSVANTIETLYKESTLLSGTSFDWPNIYIGNRDKIKTLDFSSGELVESEEHDIAPYTGYADKTARYQLPGQSSHFVWCDHYYYDYQAFKKPQHLIRTENGFLGLDFYGSMFSVSDDNITTSVYPDGGDNSQRWICFDGSLGGGVSCTNPRFTGKRYQRIGNQGCDHPDQYGAAPTRGYGVGDFSNTRFNTPLGMTKKFGDSSKVIVADSGNNRVFEMDFNTNTSTIIAGNGQTYDNGDGLDALDASIYHPRAVVYDKYGNLYISTENGYIRKIDSNGIISTFAGLPISKGGIVTDSGDARKMAFHHPYGMAVDNDNEYLYVADTSRNRVVRIDMISMIGETVAGNSTCSDNINIGDGLAALDASVCAPEFVGLDDSNNLLIADSGHKRIRRVNFNASDAGKVKYLTSTRDFSELIKNGDGSFSRTFRNGSTINYDATGRQVSSNDRTGRETSFDYDQDKLVSITDASGQETSFIYAGDNLSSIIDPAGRETSFVHDDGDLTEVIFPDNTSRKFIYNSHHLITEEINQREISTFYKYNGYRRLESVTNALNEKTLIFDGLSQNVGNSYTGGNIGELKTMEDSSNNDGIVSPKNVTTLMQKDINGYVSKITDGLNRVTTIERNLYGDPTKITRHDGTIATFTYDSETRELIQKYDTASGATGSYEYDSYGQLIKTTNTANKSATKIYNTNGTLQKSTNVINQSTSYNYYSLGLLESKTWEPTAQKTTFEYDDFGNLSASYNPVNEKTSYIRNSAGKTTSITNAKGQVTNYEYDLMNRLIKVTDARGKETEYSYTATGQLETIKDSYDNITTFDYDNLDRVVKKTNPLGFETSMSYDSNGNITQEIDPNGNVKTFTYDTFDRLVKKELPDNVYDFTYDTRGNLESVEDNLTKIGFNYVTRERGELVNEVNIEGVNDFDYIDHSINYNYDAEGNRTQLNANGLIYNYGYDFGNRLNSITNFEGHNFSVLYNSAGLIAQRRRPGSYEDYTYDHTNFMTSIEHRAISGSVVTDRFEYARDAIGNRTKAFSAIRGVTDYSYDENNQLTNVTSTTNPSENFVYDEIGNRVEENTKQYVYDSKKQRLLSDFNNTYIYDNNGNLTTKVEKATNKTTNYIYDSQNRLVEIQNFDASNVLISNPKYYYDALSRRVLKDVNGEIRKYIYDNQEMIATYDENDELLAAYTHSGMRTDDTLSVSITQKGKDKGLAKSAGTYFYEKDGLGTIQTIVDISGNNVQRYTYSSFGKILKITNSLNQDITTDPILKSHYTFTNREYDDESSLYYYRARMYEPSLGRFLTEDPHPGRVLDPLSFSSKYIYTENNPINFTDPTGLLKFRNYVALYISFRVGFSIGFISGVLLGPVGGAFAGGSLGYLTGGEVAYRTNRWMGGSKSESRNLRQKGKYAGMIGGIIGGIAGGIAASNPGGNEKEGCDGGQQYASASLKIMGIIFGTEILLKFQNFLPKNGPLIESRPGFESEPATYDGKLENSQRLCSL